MCKEVMAITYKAIRACDIFDLFSLARLHTSIKRVLKCVTNRILKLSAWAAGKLVLHLYNVDFLFKR